MEDNKPVFYLDKYIIDKYLTHFRNIKKIFKVMPKNFKRYDSYIIAMDQIGRVEKGNLDIIGDIDNPDNALRNLCLLYHLDIRELRANYNVIIDVEKY